MKKNYCLVFSLVMMLLITSVTSCVDKKEIVKEPDWAAIWVDSVYAGMSLDQKIGQLFHDSPHSLQLTSSCESQSVL